MFTIVLTTVCPRVCVTNASQTKVFRQTQKIITTQIRGLNVRLSSLRFRLIAIGFTCIYVV